MKKKFILIISVLFLSIQLWGASEAEVLTAKDELMLEDFLLYNTDSEVVFSLYQPMSEVLEFLGTPKEEKVSKHPKDEWDFILSYYDNISFGFYRSEFCINLINITGKEYKTYRGISVGDERDKVFYYYGKESIFSQKDDGTHDLIYKIIDKNHDYALLYICFSIRQGKIVEIAIYIASSI